MYTDLYVWNTPQRHFYLSNISSDACVNIYSISISLYMEHSTEAFQSSQWYIISHMNSYIYNYLYFYIYGRLPRGISIFPIFLVLNIDWNNLNRSSIPDICHNHHNRWLWRKNLPCGEISPHDRLSCAENLHSTNC